MPDEDTTDPVEETTDAAAEDAGTGDDAVTDAVEEAVDAGDAADTAAAEPEPAADVDPPQRTAAATAPAAVNQASPAEQELARLTALIKSADFDPYSDQGKDITLRRQDIAAQVAAEAPQRRAAQQADAERQYWAGWGKGDDVAQLSFARKVPAARAKALFKETCDEIAANPRYQNRKEINLQSVAYDRWMDKLEAEAKSPKTAAAPATPAAKPGARVTPANVARAAVVSNKTARQRLADGDYDLAADVRRLGMIR